MFALIALARNALTLHLPIGEALLSIALGFGFFGVVFGVLFAYETWRERNASDEGPEAGADV